MKYLSQEEILEIYRQPLLELVFKAHEQHVRFFNPSEIQASSLINIKSGGCKEDCSYCAQSVKNNSKVKVHKLMPVEEVYRMTQLAKEKGASRVCLGAAWREVRNTSDFEQILEMVRMVKSLEMEVCCTLGFVTQEQAERLAEAGLDYYNHNIETSREHYEKIVSTHTFDDRLNTIDHARKAGLNLCSGGIIGMGENVTDRISMIKTLSEMNPAPESIPVNALIPIEGTRSRQDEDFSVWDLVRTIATLRLIIPSAPIRLSAGRESLSFEGQALCFFAGANSIFLGENLLTVSNQSIQKDEEMFRILGLHKVGEN